MNAKELVKEMIVNEQEYLNLNINAVKNEVIEGNYRSLGSRASLVNECDYCINKLKVLLQRIEALEIDAKE